MKLRTCVLALAALSLGACKKETPPAAPPPAPKPAPSAPAAAPQKVDNSVASASGKSDPECVGPIDLAVPAQVTLGGKQAELSGYKLTVAEPARDADDVAVLGVLANINEDSGENLVNLGKYVEFFKNERVEAIVVVGDSGETAASIERALTPLAETGLPLFVVIGNRECAADFNDALKALQGKFPNVFNMNKVRHAELDDVDLVSLPGYHDKRYIHCATGCQYFKQDVEALKAVAKAAKNPAVLIAHGPPKGDAPMAIDAATDAGNVGDSNLNGLITEAGIRFGVFANIKEAGGRATDLSGANVVREDVFSEHLYLNPGPADSVAWALNDGTQSSGMASVVTVQGKQAKFKVFRARPLTDEEKAQAQKLAPAHEQAAETEETKAAQK